MKKQYLFFALVALLFVGACSKSNHTPAAPAISQTFTIDGISHTADTVISANGGAQIFAWNGTQYSYGMVFFFHGVPQAGTYDIVDYNSAPDAGQVAVAGYDNIHTTKYLVNAAPAAVIVSLTNGKYSIVMKTVTAKIQVNNQNPSGSANLSASFSEK